MTPDVHRVVVARFVSHVGGTAGFFIGLWGMAAYELDADPGSLALLMGVLAVTQMVAGPIAGALVDRWDPRRVVVLGEVIFVPAILTLTTAGSMADLTLRAPLAWFGSAMVLTAMVSFPPYLVSASDPVVLQRANARVEAAGTLAFILGPVAGAATVRWSGIPAVFVLDAVTSMLGVAILWPVAVRDAVRESSRQGLGELVEGFVRAYRIPAIRLVLVLGMVTWLGFGTFGALEPLFYRDVLGTDVETLGYVNAVFGVGLLLGTIGLDRSAGRLTSMRTLVVCVALCGAGVFAYAGTASLAVVVVGGFGWGLVLGVLLPLLRTMVHLHTPEGWVGRVSGVYMVHRSAGELVPLAFAPAVASAVGVQWAMLVPGVVLLAVGPLAWGAATRVDGRHRVEPAPIADDRVGEADDGVGEVDDRVPAGAS